MPCAGSLRQRVLRMGTARAVGAGASERAVARIRTIHTHSRDTYGAPRVIEELRADGVTVGHNRVARLMRSAGLVGPSRRKGCWTTRRDKDARPAPDLVHPVALRTRLFRQVYIDAGNMAVRAVPLEHAIVNFDDLESFRLEVQQSVMRIRPDVLGGMFNESIFNYPESRIRELADSRAKGVDRPRRSSAA